MKYLFKIGDQVWLRDLDVIVRGQVYNRYRVGGDMPRNDYDVLVTSAGHQGRWEECSESDLFPSKASLIACCNDDAWKSLTKAHESLNACYDALQTIKSAVDISRNAVRRAEDRMLILLKYKALKSRAS